MLGHPDYVILVLSACFWKCNQEYISAEATRLQMNAGEKQGDARISLAFSLCSAGFPARVLAKFPVLVPLMLFPLCRAVLSTSTSHDVQDSDRQL